MHCLKLHKWFLALAMFSCPLAGFGGEPPPCQAKSTVPRLSGPGDAFPGTHWAGSDALAALLPDDGIWPTTPMGALIAVKLFWWSEGFEPGLEQALHVEVTNLDDPTATPEEIPATNAYLESLNAWTMLTGIDFPSPGCWQVSGRFRAAELSFQIEVRDSADYAARKAAD